jgi:hypothetical protein
VRADRERAGPVRTDLDRLPADGVTTDGRRRGDRKRRQRDLRNGLRVGSAAPAARRRVRHSMAADALVIHIGESAIVTVNIERIPAARRDREAVVQRVPAFGNGCIDECRGWTAAEVERADAGARADHERRGQAGGGIGARTGTAIGTGARSGSRTGIDVGPGIGRGIDAGISGRATGAMCRARRELRDRDEHEQAALHGGVNTLSLITDRAISGAERATALPTRVHGVEPRTHLPLRCSGHLTAACALHFRSRMRYLGMVACVLAGGCMQSTAAQIGPNDYVRLDQGANGDVTCDRGTLYLPADASINGDLDASDCALKIEGLVNGSITASGGLVHVLAVPSVNGDLEVHDADEVVVLGSLFNGGADVENTRTVTITDSNYNNDGTFDGNGVVDIEDTFFNGSLEISGSQSCRQTGNQTNGSLDVSGCR